MKCLIEGILEDVMKFLLFFLRIFTVHRPGTLLCVGPDLDFGGKVMDLTRKSTRTYPQLRKSIYQKFINYILVSTGISVSKEKSYFLPFFYQ